MPLSHAQRLHRRKLMAEAVKGGKPPSDVAIEYGVAYGTVIHACNEFSVSVRNATVRELPAGYVPLEQWRAVDWSLRDIDIARVIGVSRERVRQVRSQLGIAKSGLQHVGSKGIRVRAWLKTHADAIPQLTFRQIRDMMPFPCDNRTIELACKALGIQYARFVPMRKHVTRETLCSFVDVADNGCWNWKLSCFPTGYASIGRNGKRGSEYASHHVFKLFHGAIPDGKWVLHTCDNPRCVNPSHLYAGTPMDNARDRMERNRTKPKFEPEIVAEIRRRFHAGERMDKLAAEYDRSWDTIYRLCIGRSYKHLLQQAQAAAPATA